MKTERNIKKGTTMVSRLNTPPRPAAAYRRATLLGRALGVLLPLNLAVVSAHAQVVQPTNGWIQMRPDIIRITVPVLFTNSFVISNHVTLTGMDSTNFPVALNVTGLPANTSSVLSNVNTGVITSISNSGDVYLGINTTNIPQGEYLFSLDASGQDTNGLPVTNYFQFVLQSGYIWYGNGHAATNVIGTNAPDISSAWAGPTNWLGGVAPPAGSDVLFADTGAQTNANTPAGIPYTNVTISANTTVGSIRFLQSVNVDANSTNIFYHTFNLSTGVSLLVTNSLGFRVMRDYIDEFAPYPKALGVFFNGGKGSALVVSNENANFSLLVDNQQQNNFVMTNLPSFVTDVNRIGIGEYQLFPNYRNISQNYNSADTNDYLGRPRRFLVNTYLAQTNILKAVYVDGNNYTNEFTRGYGLSFLDSETSGSGSSVNDNLWLGITNIFKADSVCFIRANHSTGNGGSVRFIPGFNSPGALFRNTDGVSRMSVFTVSDDGGTNGATSNVKATIDLATGNGGNGGYVDMLVDRLYIARDRQQIATNGNPNVQGDLYFGRGIIDVNTAVLGFQEHSNKVDWTTLLGSAPYLNYCQGRLYVTNGATFKINRTLTLGYTADSNPSGSAQQYNTFGQVTVSGGSVMQVSNVVVDGGLNTVVTGQNRQNNITVNNATLIVSNSIGAAPGLTLDNLNFVASTSNNITLFASGSGPNVFVKSLACSGTVPTTIKVATLNGLIPGIGSYPAQIPIISYATATAPYFKADASAVTGVSGLQAFVLNNTVNSTIDLYLTTNPPNALIWTGSDPTTPGVWDNTSLNWKIASNSAPAHFSIGDIVTFDDTAATTNVNVTAFVVPNQTTNATINASKNYTFANGNGTIAGTFAIVKTNTGDLTVNAIEQGSLTVLAGSLDGGGQIGATTIASNVVMNFSGMINGGLTSTGAVTLASSGSIAGPVSIQGGSFANFGNVSTAPGTLSTGGNCAITNGSTGTLAVYGGNWNLSGGCTMDNVGVIQNYVGRMQVLGLFFGTGFVQDLTPSVVPPTYPGRVIMENTNTAVIAPGSAPGVIGSMTLPRIDLNDNNPNGSLGRLMIDVDFNNPQTNDYMTVDLWNNIQSIIVMTNINPGFRSFQAGDSFWIFRPSFGAGYVNNIDVYFNSPVMSPLVPAPGLQWDLTNFRTNGIIGVSGNQLVWNGNVSTNWDFSTANWKGNLTYSDVQGVQFDDSAAVTTVNLLTNVAPAGYPFFSNGVPMLAFVGTNFSAWVTNNYATIFPGIVISNTAKDYVFNQNTNTSRISGLTSLYKLGSGTLTMNATNDYMGNTYLAGGGTLVVNMLTNIGASSPIGSMIGNANSAGKGNSYLSFDNATLDYTGGTANINTKVVLAPGGGTIEIASNATQLIMNASFFSSEHGSGALTKTGPGNLTLSGANAYDGGTTVSTGTLGLWNNTGAGSGSVTLASGAVLQLTNVNVGNPLSVSGNTQIQELGAGPSIIGGLLSGSGTVTFSNAAASFVFNAALTNFSGTLSLGTSTGSFRFNNSTNSNPCRGSTLATFDLGTGSATLSNLNGGGLVYDLGALSGGANTVLAGRLTNNTATNATLTYSIGANGNSTSFSGKIADGLDASSVVSVVKVGTGTLYLNGASTFSGAMTVSNGVLGGSGRIAGALNVTPGGTLNPGATIGTFTVGGSATLSGAVLMELNQANSPAANDMLSVAGTITTSGTLVVTNVGPNIRNGSTFKLFNKAVTGFASVTLPPTDPTGGSPYVWNNNIGVDGSITLVSGGAPAVNTSATNMTATFTSSSMTLTWPTDHIGWELLSNSAGLAYPGNWFPVANTVSTNSATIPFDVTKSNVFYRLTYPPQ